MWCLPYIYSTIYNSQSNGVCERFNASMCDSLVSICNKKRTNWDQQLWKRVFAYNARHHFRTKLTPFKLMFGRLYKQDIFVNIYILFFEWWSLCCYCKFDSQVTDVTNSNLMSKSCIPLISAFSCSNRSCFARIQ